MNATKKSLKLPYKSRLGNNDAKWGYLFILPALLLFLVFTAYPLISAFTISFQKYRPMGSVFVWFESFFNTFSSELFWKALWNTLIYTIGSVPVSLIISFALAMLMTPLRKWAQTVFKACYYLPILASGVTLSIVWLWIFDPFDTGLLNRFVSLFGIESQNWLGTSKTAMFSLLLMTWLGNHGKNIIIYSAALAGIPQSLFEAADIEGANSWVKIRRIVIPLLKPTTLFLLVTGIITSFQVFQTAYLMTGGGPNNATTTIGFLIFRNAFTYFDYGAACAQALVLTVIIVALTAVQFKWLGNDVEY